MDQQAFELLLKRFDDVDRQFSKGQTRMDEMHDRIDELWHFRKVLLLAVSVAGTIGGAIITFSFNFIVSLFAK
jgi:hypothetical protein